jgi:hypothetical protein
LAAPVGPSQLVVVALSVLAGDALAATFVVRRLKRAIRPERLLDRSQMALTCAAALAMLPAVIAGRWLGLPLDGQALVLAVVTGGFGVVALGCFVVVLQFGSKQRRPVT